MMTSTATATAITTTTPPLFSSSSTTTTTIAATTNHSHQQTGQETSRETIVVSPTLSETKSRKSHPLQSAHLRAMKHNDQQHNKEENSKNSDYQLLMERRKDVIRSSWRAVQFGLDVKATEIFYNKLFEEHPQVRSIFPNDMSAQYQKLYSAVSMVVRVLDEPEELLPVLKDLGIRHARYGATRDYYEAVTECFLWTLNSYIVSKMPNNNALRWIFGVVDAWEWALTFIGITMADAAEEEIARIRDDEEARKAMEEALRISGSADDGDDDDGNE
jgi:hemoglobin-like flavoprotein